ncbi:tRNA(m5U54)methyltransferase [Tulasnella sp. JGI-2019a]|nr:tRNA(m5U54)methyltransferase [Tulasnella sp. JGI-2019a]
MLSATRLGLIRRILISRTSSSFILPGMIPSSAHPSKRAVTPIAGTVKRPRLDEPENLSTQHDAQVAGPSNLNQDVVMGDAAPAPRPSKVSKPKKFKRPPPPEAGSSEDVILHDVMALIGPDAVETATAAKSDYASPLEKGQEVELVVSELSSNGESLSLLPSPSKPWAVLVPFALPGEIIRARVYASARFHSLADLVAVVKPNEQMRDMDRVKCRYFGVCAGCQYQMLSYETQLELKRKVVEKAYTHFSGLPTHVVPPILPTIPSPKTYGYRTKITPHFDVAPNSRGKRRGKDAKSDQKDATPAKPFDLTIGFGEKGRRRVIDIEECVIATPMLNKALTPARENVQRNIDTYKRGATLLLRDSLRRPAPSHAKDTDISSGQATDPVATQPTNPTSPNTTEIQSIELPEPVQTPNPSSDAEEHICITDHKATVRERVGDTLFEFPAGSFFQNNNSVLPSLVEYVRNAIFTPSTSEADRPTHLVDTYCGSGLFAISLAPAFVHVAGVEISADSIASARQNALLNGLPPSPTSPSTSPASNKNESIVFTAGKSESIFSTVSHFPAARTVVIIDPPRKGCDKPFLEQLVAFRPAKLVYVSCNVHTQARDVGDLLRMMEGAGAEKGLDGDGTRKQTYVIESLRGLDLFPQTSHVESVAVLRLTDVNG